MAQSKDRQKIQHTPILPICGVINRILKYNLVR